MSLKQKLEEDGNPYDANRYSDPSIGDVYMDMVGPLLESFSGNKLILTFPDDVPKYMKCRAKPDGEASTIARVFFGERVWST